jgi:hypothetical protein
MQLNPDIDEFIPNKKISSGNNNKKGKIFLFNDKEVFAGGILLYTIKNKKKYFLLRKDKYNRWSDLGGKIEDKDSVLYDTLTRELLEETNNKIYNILNINNSYDTLKAWIIKSNYKIIYNEESKYLLLKIRINNNFNINNIINAENTTVQWIFIDKSTKIKLNPRILKYYFKI